MDKRFAIPDSRTGDPAVTAHQSDVQETCNDLPMRTAARWKKR